MRIDAVIPNQNFNHLARPSENSAKGQEDQTSVQVSRGQSNLNKNDLKNVTNQINEVLKAFDIQARFSVHEQTNEIMVSIVNMETHEVIREIPPKKILDMIARMMEMVGVIIDEKA